MHFPTISGPGVRAVNQQAEFPALKTLQFLLVSLLSKRTQEGQAFGSVIKLLLGMPISHNKLPVSSAGYSISDPALLLMHTLEGSDWVPAHVGDPDRFPASAWLLWGSGENESVNAKCSRSLSLSAFRIK